MISSELEAEWHPTLNLPLVFKESLPTKNKFWWLGSCGHEWESLLSYRKSGSGCPYCSGKKVLVGFNDFASQYPVLLSQWHPTKNIYSPYEITPKTKKLVWWVCPEGHEWESRVLSRSNGAGCPMCSGNKILAGFNDLASQNPTLAAEWHPTKNDDLTPSMVGKSSNKKVWWQCKENHEWETVIGDRVTKGINCHYCSGFAITLGVNDLFTLHPHLKQELHPTKNSNDLNISLERVNSQKKVWWLGRCDHEWESTIQSRTVGHGCVYCGGNQLLVGFNDLASQNPTLAAEWHPTKNILSPNEVNAKSGKKFWWLGECGHEWEAQLSNRDNGAGCSICAGKTILVGFNDLASQNLKLAGQWYPIKNGSLTAQEIMVTSNKKVWWLCSEGHEWEVSPNGRRTGTGCPYCSGNKVLRGFNDLETVGPLIAIEWHPTKNGSLSPQNVTRGSKKLVWWLCPFGHEWQVMVTERNYYNCPVCAGSTVLTGFNDLATTNPTLASEWHPTLNDALTAQQVSKGSGVKIWWVCTKKHEWKALVSDRNYGSGCPRCANHVSKAETEIQEFLISLGLTVEPSNRTVLGGKEIDLWIPSHNVGIEFNGIYWHTEKRRGVEAHYDKYLAAKKAGIQLIQIWEDDWNQKQEVVKRLLADKLGVGEKVLAENTNVITITDQQAEDFLNGNHIQGSAEGSHYLGLVSKGDIETLKAVMVLDKEPETDGKVLNIIRYATSADIVGGFMKLLNHAIKTYQPESVTTLADHCMSDGKLYESNAFIAEKTLPPDYMYVVKNERKHRSEYPLERFRDDPKLLWEEGLTEMELADLNGLDRIWDAGKTCCRLLVVKRELK